MPRCYMVKKGNLRHEGPPPCSPTEASVAPPCYSPTEHSALTEPQTADYGGPNHQFFGRSAADTEAAHDLLSLAQSLPPLPPPAVLTVLHSPEPPSLPVYTYTIQPTNIYILADEQPEIYHTVQTVADVPIEFIESPIVVDQNNEAEIIQVQEYTHEYSPEYTPQYTPEYTQETEPEAEEATPPPSPVSEEPKSIPTSVIKHASSKKKKARYDCSVCGKRYATSSNLSRHKQTHRSLDSLAARRCGECGKVYVSMPALAMHVLTHRMGHVCGVCGKQFSRPWLLRGHLRSHTGEKPYNCDKCGRAFADRSNLRAHQQTHSQDKNFECSRCGKTFALKSYMTKHQESACIRDV